MNFPSNLKIFVLAPSIENGDENIDYYYDFTQSIAEYTKVFSELQLNWQWTPITINNFKEVILAIKNECELNHIKPLFFNLCDGDELNEAPGISVIKYLNELELNYTGSDEYFYNITTSKADMKDAFDECNVANAHWIFIEKIEDVDDSIFEKIGSPIIVKPSVSGGSMGVGVKNVVHNLDELNEQVEKMLLGYRGWNLNAGGIIAEEFINGAEFTVFISGNYDEPQSAHIYTPVERVFHPSLPAEEKFLSFDRLWEIYEDETQMPNEENFYDYALPNENLIEDIKQISWNAYAACKGKGYTRVDVRMDAATKKLFVLEVNAQCGLSEDEDYTSIGAILKFSNVSFTSLVKEIITNELQSKGILQHS
jgi:D-alanine-D-alanine ligase